MVIHEKENKQIYPFKVGYMLNTRFNINKAFREQVENNMALTFSSTTIMPIKRVLGNIKIVFFHF